MSKEESKIEFPCKFPIKAMGKTSNTFESIVVGIVRKHAPDLGEGAVQTNASKEGNYLAVTITVHAKSQAQLDAIYKDLSDHKDVIMAL